MSDVRRSAGWLADKLAEQDRRLNLVESRKPGLAQSSIEDGAIDEFTADGTFASSVGKQPDGSHVAFPATGPKPATPVKATLKSTPGLVEVRWSGKFENDDVSTLDFKHVAVHASNTPDVDISPAAQLATIRGELGDVASIVAEEGMLYVVLVAWTAAGKASNPSQVAAVAVAAPANANLIQDALTDLDTKYDGVVTEAGQLGGRLDTAETDLIDHETRLQDADQQLADAFGQLNTVDTRVATAKQAAIDAATAAAAADATAKKEQAEANAAAAAAIDAQARADAAQQAAEAAAAAYADAQASGASADALAAAKADATAKADAAKAAAITAAAADATAKKEQAEANAAVDAKAKADAALASAKTYADTQAEAATFAAITAMGFSRNPSFDDWPGSLPVGFATYGTPPTKETSIVRRGKYAARFNCTDTTTSRGLNLSGGAIYDLPAGVEYWTVELSFQLVSGTTLAGFGVLLDWAGMTGNRAVLSLAAEIPNPVTGKWYTVSKTLQRPANASGTNTGMAGYLMGNYSSGLGGMAVKDVVVDWFNVRPATAEEITAGLALTMAGSKSRVYYSTGVASGVATADGDLWRQRDASNNIIAEWRWNGTPPAGSWVKTAISSEAISNLDVGKLTAGTANMLQATIDKLVAATAAFQTVDVANLFATNSTMSQAVIDKLWADVIHAYKITTDMLLVGGGANLIPWDPTTVKPHISMNGSVVTPAMDADVGQTLQVVNNTVVAGTFKSTLRFGSGATATNGAANTFEVVEGESYRVQVGVGGGGTYVDGTPQARVVVQTYNAAGTYIGTSYGAAAGMSYSGALTFATLDIGPIPQGITSVAVYLQQDKQGLVMVHRPSLMVKASAVTIADGAVTAEKLISLLVLASEIIAGNPNGTHAKMTPNGFRVMAAGLDGGAPVEVIRLGTDTDDYLGVVNAAQELVASISSTGGMTAQELDVAGDVVIAGTSALERFDQAGGNIIARASRGTDGLYYAGTTPHPYLSLQVDGIKGGRAYMVQTSPIGVTSDSANSDAVVNLHYQSGADRAATTSDPIIMAASSVPSGWSTAKRNPATINRLVTPSVDGTMALLLSYGVESTGRAKITTGGGRSVFLTVTDMGPSVPETGEDRNGTSNAASGGSTGGETTAPVSKKNYDKTWPANAIQSYLGSGGQYNYSPHMYSGNGPVTSNGDLMSIAVFPDVKSEIGGGTVTGVWVYVYYDFWWYGAGGNAYIGLHGQLGVPTTKPAKTYSHAVVNNWPRAAGKWVKMSSSTYAGWAAGTHRGFTLGGSGGGLERYGYAHDARLRITWTK